ncbi:MULTISPECIES: hypothetical protein [unclassified Bosea (in: a-proteobacteria)]|uniref:hypothetical protein n=1 Tax=unclassified Bosea (in: a-proteobacteria) TaxID=2653178 RepID=UPI000F74E505|nr:MULTISPECIES: hypothetical protein [unclassified Bosea (in: a-proteobacteria)]AZO77740.1 hypothetical protein BLM15_09000 [Bosea sp. Tri-49]RXT18354.1 hypothetical protein B5U98_24155 [Bosea sp. Tri-39]RXT32950.1 hypothetical protein B5U99_30500 [Bosea sp. Tri-54]
MPKRGVLKPGSIAAQVLSMVAEGQGAAVSRNDIGKRLQAQDRRWLGRTLGTLQLSSLIVEVAGGFRLADAAAPEPPFTERLAPPLPEHSRSILAAIVRRAHRLRAGGIVVGAAELVRSAARKVAPHPAAQDLSALADLFEHAPALYPVLDLPQRTAA